MASEPTVAPTALEIEVAMCLVEALEEWSADLRRQHEAVLAGAGETGDSAETVREGGDASLNAA
jgi:hypothetical protein